jgi:methyl-accepting chemotaxis protein
MHDHSTHSGLSMVAKAVKNRRRTLLVNPAAQKRFVLSISIPALLMLLAVGVWAVWIDASVFDDVSTAGESSLPSFLPFGVGVFVAILVFGATIVVQALRVSHRVEGSAYRIVRSMERIRTGDLDFTIKLRNKDHLQDVAAELNRLMDWLRTRLPAQPTSRSSTTGGTPAGSSASATAPLAAVGAAQEP